MDNPTKEDALLSLLLKKQQEVVRDVKVKRNLSYSDSDIQDFKLLIGVRKTGEPCLGPKESRFQTADFSGVYLSGSNTDCLGRQRGSRTAVRFPNHNSLKTQFVPMCRRTSNGGRRPLGPTGNSSASSNAKGSLYVMEEGTQNKLRCYSSTQGVRNIRAQVEVELAKDEKGCKKSFCKYLGKRRQSQSFLIDTQQQNQEAMEMPVEYKEKIFFQEDGHLCQHLTREAVKSCKHSKPNCTTCCRRLDKSLQNSIPT